MDIKVEGVRGVRADFSKATKEIDAAAMLALEAMGLDIVAEAKENIQKNGSHVSGNLIASGKVQKLKDGTIDAGFFGDVTETGQGYAAAYEYGRRAGKCPPIKPLKAWLKKRNDDNPALHSMVIHMNARARKHKNRTADDLLEMAAMAMAIHIGKHGTKPHPFFAPAVKLIEGKVQQYVDRYIKRKIK